MIGGVGVGGYEQRESHGGLLSGQLAIRRAAAFANVVYCLPSFSQNCPKHADRLSADFKSSLTVSL